MKKIMLGIVFFVTSMTSIICMSSFTVELEKDKDLIPETHVNVSCQGKHCTGTVGCSCSGFSPKTNGKVWEKSYCRRCGHHKNYHK